MKKIVLIFAISIFALLLPAQSNEPVRLALISESTEASTADILTVQLSSNQKLHLLERNEIERVYREQGLSAGNRDYLKLGQILGADGLLILSAVAEDTNQISTTKPASLAGMFGRSAENGRQLLDVRLIAVKPGVVMGAIRSVWSAKDSLDWAQGIARLFAADFPKLRVLVKDAIPISVVNLRSAVQSAGALEQERELKLLTIQRLSREPQFFVLERQQMQLLSEEKDLKADESPFWSGSYLLEGVVDQNGYSEQTTTINSRLIPPKGGVPLSLEVSGSRTNLPQLINQLAVKVSEALQINSSASEWNAADEAKEFLDEARWALKWKIYSEAQAAAESAWALGKRDMDCASARVRSYMVPDYRTVERGSLTITEVNPSRATLAKRPPGPQTADRARRALELYLDYNRALPGDGVKPDSEWCRLGIENLISASRVLQHFYLVPSAQEAGGDQLAELRAAARTVADSIIKWPLVHGSYFVGDRLMTGDELTHARQEGVGIFNCEIKWGGFWRERPEDAVAMYRELMDSPLFVCIHNGFWFREPNSPRLVVWGAVDDKHASSVWQSFEGEMNASTNALMQLEAKAVELADARSAIGDFEIETRALKQGGVKGIEASRIGADEKLEKACEALFDFAITNYEAVVSGRDQLLDLDWELGAFFNRGGTVNATTEKLDLRFKNVYAPRFAAAREDYMRRNHERLLEKKNLPVFDEQKRFLAEHAAYEFQRFNQMFSFREYSKRQASELQPLIADYKSNLLAKATTRSEKFRAQGAAQWIGTFLEKQVNEILSPSVSPVVNAEMSRGANPQPMRIPQPATPTQKPPAAWSEGMTNVLLVKDYFRIPQELLRDTNISGMAVTSYRWSEGKLLLGLRYQSRFENYNKVSQAATAIFNSQNGTWDIIKYPAAAPRDVTINRMFPAEALFGFHGSTRDASFELFHGDFYLSDGGEIKKFDFAARQWTILEVPENQESKFFAVEQRLLAANKEGIFEIIDAGHGSRILASTRRRPAVSVLDSWDDLGSPVLFPGPNHSLRAWIKGNVFIWKESDWHEEFAMNSSRPPEIFEDTVLARDMASLDGVRFWTLGKEQSAPDLCLLERQRSGANIIVSQSRKSDTPAKEPLWKNLEDARLGIAPAASFKSNLSFLVDHPMIADGQHAVLICLVRDVSKPLAVPLTFDTQQGPPPISSGARGSGSMTLASWLRFSDDRLFLGNANCPGVWSIPVSSIEAAIATQKQALLANKPSLNNP